MSLNVIMIPCIYFFTTIVRYHDRQQHYELHPSVDVAHRRLALSAARKLEVQTLRRNQMSEPQESVLAKSTQNLCKINAKPMQNQCKINVKPCKIHAKSMQNQCTTHVKPCKINAKSMYNPRKTHATSMQNQRKIHVKSM